MPFFFYPSYTNYFPKDLPSCYSSLGRTVLERSQIEGFFYNDNAIRRPRILGRILNGNHSNDAIHHPEIMLVYFKHT